MKLISLYLRGAKGIKDGLGLDEVTVDFDQLDPGLICLIGPNGAGKTTLVENLTPFRYLKSRPGKLANQFYLKDSRRDLVMSMNGDEYRFLLNIDGESKNSKMESFVYKNGDALNPDGKKETYNEIVAKLFGSDDLYWRSVFMPQGGDSLYKLPPSQRKELILELISQSGLQDKSEAADKQARAVIEKTTQFEFKISQTKETITGLGNPWEMIKELENTKFDQVSSLNGFQENIKYWKIETERLQTQSTDQAVVRSKLETTNASLEQLEASKRTLAIDYERDSGNDNSKITGLKSELTQVEQESTSDEAIERLQTQSTEQAVITSDLETIKSNLDQLLENETKLVTDYNDTAKARSQKTVTLKLELEEAKQNVASDETIEALKKDIEQLNELQTEYGKLKELKDSQGKYQHELDTAKAKSENAYTRYCADIDACDLDLQNKERAAGLLDKVPCQCDELLPEEMRATCSSCPLLKDAIAAQGAISGLKAKARGIEDDWGNDKERRDQAIALLQKQIADTGFDKDRYTEVWKNVHRLNEENPSRKLHVIEYNTGKIDGLARQISELEEIEETLKNSHDAQMLGVSNQITALIVKRQGLQNKIDTEIETKLGTAQRNKREVERLTGQISEIEAAIRTVEENYQSQKVNYDNQITGLVTNRQSLESKFDPDIDKELEEKKKFLEECQTEEKNLLAQLTEVQAKLEAAQKDKARLESAKTELTDMNMQLSQLQTGAADWKDLALSMSRNGGYQSYLVESAGQQITPFANDLLGLYGVPWNIEIQTSRPSADGKKAVEGFFVIINTPDGPRELGDLSGGQEVWIEHVIYAAISQMMRQNGFNSLTQILDEADGALDADHALAYLRAVQSAHDLSKLHHTILISHRQGIQEVIPQRIRLIPGEGIKVEIE